MRSILVHTLTPQISLSLPPSAFRAIHTGRSADCRPHEKDRGELEMPVTDGETSIFSLSISVTCYLLCLLFLCLVTALSRNDAQKYEDLALQEKKRYAVEMRAFQREHGLEQRICCVCTSAETSTLIRGCIYACIFECRRRLCLRLTLPAQHRHLRLPRMWLPLWRRRAASGSGIRTPMLRRSV